MHGESALQSLDLFDRRRTEGAVRNVVELDEIDVAERAGAEVDERLHFGVGVIDAVNHCELVGRAPTGLFDVFLDSLVEAEQRELFDAGHKLVARGLDGRVKRNGEGELFGKLGEATDSRDNAASGHGEVASADGEAIRVVEHAKSLDGVVEVGKRLTLAHEHDAGHPFSEVAGNMEHLIDHLLGGERSGKAGEAGRAERAAHGATRLRGNADGEFVAVGHADGLDGDAVGKLEQILARAVFGDLLDELGGDFEGEGFGQRLAEARREVGHFVERTNVLFVDPFVELLGAKSRLSEFLHEVFEVIEIELTNIA